VNEDPVYSQPVTVDLSSLFVDFVPVSLVETSLTANQPLKSMSRMKWNSTTTLEESETTDEASVVIQLKPMEIRTFLVNFERRS